MNEDHIKEYNDIVEAFEKLADEFDALRNELNDLKEVIAAANQAKIQEMVDRWSADKPVWWTFVSFSCQLFWILRVFSHFVFSIGFSHLSSHLS